MIIVILFGCTTVNRNLIEKEESPIDNLRLVRRNTPEVQVVPSTGAITVGCLGGLLIGGPLGWFIPDWLGVGGAVGGAITGFSVAVGLQVGYMLGKALFTETIRKKEILYPDFGELVI